MHVDRASKDPSARAAAWILSLVASLTATGLSPCAASAALLAWNGTFTLAGVNPAAQLPPLVGPGMAISAAAPSPQLLRLRGGISATGTLLVSDPIAVAESGLAAIQLAVTLGIGTLAPLPPLPVGELLSAGTLPVFGALRFCLLSAACSSALTLPLASAAGVSAVGAGGLLVAGGPGPLRISLEAAPWTVGTASLARATPGGGSVTAFAFGFVHGPISASGSTAASGGELQLVTPLAVTANALPEVSGFGHLRIRFVPEPGRLLLIGSALLALLTLHQRRTRP